MKSKIAILLASYNGADFIEEQIKSILEQTISEQFDLIIRDDGSSDSTREILDKYKNDERITVIENNSCVRGHLSNFSELFEYAKLEYEYILFSDQDDIWEKDKLVREYRLIKEFDDKPTLVYTNFNIWNMATDEREVFIKAHLEETFPKLLVNNWIFGCTMMLNKKMIELVGNIPLTVETHDYWIALCASANKNSKIIYDDYPSLQHRLHANNATGTQDSKGIKKRFKYVIQLINRKVPNKRMQIFESCQNELISKYGINNEGVVLINSILKNNRLLRWYSAFKNGFKGLNWHATLAFYFTILFGENK